MRSVLPRRGIKNGAYAIAAAAAIIAVTAPAAMANWTGYISG
jgi:hypothetical protein